MQWRYVSSVMPSDSAALGGTAYPYVTGAVLGQVRPIRLSIAVHCKFRLGERDWDERHTFVCSTIRTRPRAGARYGPLFRRIFFWIRLPTAINSFTRLQCLRMMLPAMASTICSCAIARISIFLRVARGLARTSCERAMPISSLLRLPCSIPRISEDRPLHRISLRRET